MKMTQYVLLIVLGVALGIGAYALFSVIAPGPKAPSQDELIGGKTKEEIAEEFLRDLEAGVYDDYEPAETTIE